MSDSSLKISDGDTTVADFTTTGSYGYGSDPLKEMEAGSWAMFAGDSDLDGMVTANDFNDWLVETKAVTTGYRQPDFDLDGQVTSADFNLWLVNTKAVASSQVPD
jgi:hypothetical protein